jgi:hypothetical protein
VLTYFLPLHNPSLTLQALWQSFAHASGSDIPTLTPGFRKKKRGIFLQLGGRIVTLSSASSRCKHGERINVF